MKLENLVFDFDKFASEMANLKEKKHFDYLVTIVGEDFGGEEGLGCIYILENTDTHERTSVKMLAKQVGEINWELEEIRKTLPELKTRIDLTPVQKSLTEMQRSLTEMNKLLERVGNLSEKYSCKWIRWLPDFSLLVALKWIALLLVIGAAAMAGWYGVVAIRSLFP